MRIHDNIINSIKKITGMDFREYQLNSIVDIECYELFDVLGLKGKTEVINSVTVNVNVKYDDFMDFYNLLLITDMGKAERQIIKHNNYSFIINIIVKDAKTERIHKIMYNIGKKERTADE